MIHFLHQAGGVFFAGPFAVPTTTLKPQLLRASSFPALLTSNWSRAYVIRFRPVPGVCAFIGLAHDIDGLVHISQISEERVDKIKNVLTVGQEVTARVVKIDRAERRIGLSVKAANYNPEQLKEEQKILDALKPGEDLVALQHAFDAAEGDK